MKSNSPSQTHPNSFKINIENFEKTGKIKSTDFSTIYSVIDKKTGQTFAAKVLKNGKNGEKKTINREISIMMIFQHPTIIKFYGYSPIDLEKTHHPTIIMDLAQEGSLYDVLMNVRMNSIKNFTNTKRQIILTGVARGMMFLHQHHVIHRDLKTSNILLDAQLRPHITDFGRSKTIDTGEELFQSGPQGDAFYMAPELLKKQRYNGKVDVYSYGIIMYEVLTNACPYPEYKNKNDVHELRDKVLNGYRPKFTASIKKSFRRLIERCWSKDPNERPTFEEIFNKLAFNIDNSVYDIYDEVTEEEKKDGEIEDDENKYYLENVDIDEFLSYIDDIAERDNVQENDPLLEAINDLKRENEELRKQVNTFTQQIMDLSKFATKIQQEFNDEMDQQFKINEANIEKLKIYKKEIKVLKKRLQSKEKDQTTDLLIDLTKYKKGKVLSHHTQGKSIVYKATPLGSENSKNEAIAIRAYKDDDETKIQKDLFISEITTRASLANIAVLPLIGYSLPTEDDENYSIISPYMANNDLHHIIQKVSKGKGPANWDTIRAINIFGIAVGLNYLHENNIICIDLNSSSIILNENYYPKIDKINLSSLPKKPLPEFKKPIYIAPELYENSNCSNKADVYSYALILYELFALKLPTTEKCPIIRGSRPSLDEIPPQYIELIESCWSQEPNSRPTFKQIVQDFITNGDKYFNMPNIDKEILQNYTLEALNGIETPDSAT